jgi:hypothetical protein
LYKGSATISLDPDFYNHQKGGLMSNLNQELEGIQRLEGQTTAKQKQAGNRMARLRRRIKAGETTGDRIKDFVIAQWGSLDEHLLSRYRSVEERLARHVGELALFVTRTRVSLDFSMVPRSSRGPSTITEKWYLGVVKEPSLALEVTTGECTMVTERFVESKHPFDVLEGNVPPVRHLVFPPALEDYLESTARMIDLGEPAKRSGELLIGDAEVEAWFEKKRLRDALLCRASRLLGHPMEESDEYKAAREKRCAEALKQVRAFSIEALKSQPGLKAALETVVELGAPDVPMPTFSELCKLFGIKI